MAGRMKGTEAQTIIMIIGGLIILISVLAIGISVYQAYRWGPCWAGFSQEMAKIENAFEKLKVQEQAEVTVSMGECVGALLFVSSDELRKAEEETGKKFMEELNCPDTKGFVIGLPYYQETISSWRFWRWKRDLWENVVRFWSEKVRDMGPLCRGLDRGVSLEDVAGPGSGKTKMVCITVGKTESDYKVSIKEGSCA